MKRNHADSEVPRDRPGAASLLALALPLGWPQGGALGLLVLLLLAVAGVWWWRRRRDRPRGHAVRAFEGDPPLIFPILPSDPPEILPASRAPARPRPPLPPAAPRAAARRPRRVAEDAAVAEAPQPSRSRPKRSRPMEVLPNDPAEAPTAPPATTPVEPLRPAAVISPAARAGGAVPVRIEEEVEEGELFEGNTVRYYRPVEGTMQFLPGRLEIVEGEDRGQDIRFVRIWGATPEVTFGRSAGPPHRHVQLRARTVSREHARMNFEGDRWRIRNLSQTNPIVVNGQELHAADELLILKEGDLIEMGEVVFRFRER